MICSAIKSIAFESLDHFKMPSQGLIDLLKSAALHEEKGLIVYPPGNLQRAIRLSYRDLLRRASANARALRQIHGLTRNTILLVHFDNHLDNIEWIWSALLAGYIPAISTPFTNSIEQRKKHILHLQTLLCDPVCLTRSSLVSEFACQESLKTVTVEALSLISDNLNLLLEPDRSLGPGSPAILMLTSGSTGDAKAVSLSHTQIFASIKGKTEFFETQEGDTFLNWIGLDHVANLTEVHLHAMYLGNDQVHIHAADALQDPLAYLELLSQHRVAFSFAPNFFLNRVKEALSTSRLSSLSINLQHLRVLTSGGEANVVDTCEAISDLFQGFGARKDVVCPGFGMTETCAGSIFNKSCPQIDRSYHRDFAALGRCIPGINLRITIPDEGGRLAKANEQGQLEVCGPIVFKRYFNDQMATDAAFTHDGWFRTGDLAFVDNSGYTNLCGRSKELINVNGVKYSPHKLENVIEEASIEGATPSFTVAFSYRTKDSQTEQVCVVYLPSYAQNDVAAQVLTIDTISRVAMMYMGIRPYVLPLSRVALQKSTLGKLSRSKIQATFVRGGYSSEQHAIEQALRLHRITLFEAPTDEFEEMLLHECLDSFGFSSQDVGVKTNIFDMGVNSMNLLRWKQRLQTKLSIINIPIITIMKNPTIRLLAESLKQLQKSPVYDPVVVLQSGGSRTPLWLVHPGVGEVLVFIGLAKCLIDRPVYALRARGFDGEDIFGSISEATRVYREAIKKKQPKGPYALAGYSYGSMLAFEIAKEMKGLDNDNIKFLGSFNLPPHIKLRMQQLDWIECLLNLTYFLELLEHDFALSLSERLHHMESRDQILATVIALSAKGRLKDLDLDQKSLHIWADLALGLQSMARDYDPSGEVESIDVFCATPLAAVAKSREEWMDRHLSRWEDFCATQPRYHQVDGAHYTMIGPDHVNSFQKALSTALRDRGI